NAWGILNDGNGIADRLQCGSRRVGADRSRRKLNAQRPVLSGIGAARRADMGGWLDNRGESELESNRHRPGHGRSSSRRHPQCDELEPRRLLSKSSVLGEGYLSPGAAEVARAQAMMSSVAGPEFQKYTGDLQRLEQSSNVTPRQFARLRNDIQQLAV